MNKAIALKSPIQIHKNSIAEIWNSGLLLNKKCQDLALEL